MKHLFIVFLVLLGISKVAIGQSVGIRGWMSETARGLVGQVLSDKGGAVPYAHVFFIHGKDTIPMVCDAVGAFSWQTNRVPDSLQIRVTAIGYKTLESRYIPKNQGNRLLIRMEQESVALNEVIVTAKKVYMVVKGDTLEYKAESFKTLEGDFIGNLLKKMPGISFENGALSVNGETIHRIYVNGEDFGSKNAVLTNIKADNVKDIQVYDERNKEDQAAGMKYGRRETVMNVVTKKKVDRNSQYWRNGNLLLGTGWDMSDNPISRFKQKWNLQFNYDVPIENNSKVKSGKLLNLNGEYKNIGTGSYMQNSKFTVDFRNRRQISSAERSQNKTLYYRTQNTYTNSRGYSWETNNREYFPSFVYASRIYAGHNVGKSCSWKFSSNHSFAYKKIDWRFNFDGGEHENNRNSRERTETDDTVTSVVHMQYHTKTQFSSGKTKLTFPLMKGINFITSLDLSKGKTENRQIDTLPESNQQKHLEQEYNRQEATWMGDISYHKTLSLFNFSIGYTYSSSKNKEEGKSVNQLTSRLDANGTRDYTFYQQAHSLGGGITVSTQKMDFTAGMSVQRLFRNHVERFPYRKQYYDDFLCLSAKLRINQRSSRTFNWDLTYELAPQLPTISQTRREIETSNPLFLRAGNPNLKPEKKHVLNVNFNRLFVSNATNLKGKVSYTLMHDFIAMNDEYFQKETYLSDYDYTVMAGSMFATPQNTKASHDLSVSLDYSKFSGLLESKVDINGVYNYQKTPSFIQGKANDNITNRGQLRLQLTTAFSRKVEVFLFSFISISNTKSDVDRASNILTQNNSISFRTSLIPKCKISTKFSYSYNKNYATGNDNALPNLEMTIEPQLWRFASLKLEGKNLLNQQSGVKFVKNAIYTGRTEKAQTGSYVMLTFTQKLR